MSTVILKSAEFLKLKFSEKKEKNESYSLRSFSKKAGLSHAALSGFFSGASPLGPERAKKISEKLNFSEIEKNLLVSLSEFEQEKDAHKRSALLKVAKSKIKIWKRNQIQQVTVPKSYEIASINFLLLLKIGVQPKSPLELGRIIKKSASQTQLMIDDLLAAGWISGDWGNFKLINTEYLSSFAEDVTERRAIYKNIFECSLVNLTKNTAAERIIGSESFAIESALLPELRKITFTFLDQVAELANRSENPDTIVHTIANSIINFKKEVL